MCTKSAKPVRGSEKKVCDSAWDDHLNCRRRGAFTYQAHILYPGLGAYEAQAWDF